MFPQTAHFQDYLADSRQMPLCVLVSGKSSDDARTAVVAEGLTQKRLLHVHRLAETGDVAAGLVRSRVPDAIWQSMIRVSSSRAV
jgi:hypothetical protein